MRRLLVAVAVAAIVAGLSAPPASAIYIPVNCSGCDAWPLWAQIVVPIVGVGLGYAFLYLPYRLSRRARSPRQRVLIQWGGSAFLVIGFVVLARLAVVMFGDSGSTFTQAGAFGPTSTPPEAAMPSEPTSRSPGSPAISGIGAPVIVGDQTVVVEKVELWAGDGIFALASGDVYVTVELAVTPSSTDAFVDILDTTVQANDGTSYDAGFLGSRDPSLPVGTLTPGTTVQGWMTFEVPSDLAGQLTLMYGTGIGSPPASIKLY